MSTIPPPAVVAAFESGLVRVLRRVEVCEADGTTIWNPAPDTDPDFKRLVDGTVSLDYNSAERRKLDLVLDNKDKLLRPDPEDGFWYDKVIKVYRGVEFLGKNFAPPTAIIEAPDDVSARELSSYLYSLGFTNTDDYRDATNSSELRSYDFIVAFTGTESLTKSALLEEMWGMGKHVLTIGIGSDETDIPLYTGSDTGVTQWGISPSGIDNPAWGTFIAESVGSPVSGARPTATGPGTVAVAVYPVDGEPDMVTAALRSSAQGGRWFDVHLPIYTGLQTKRMIRAVMNFMRGYNELFTWECQQGEFLIDTINADHFPNQVKITGRDFTKKLLLSKVAFSVTFEAGTSLNDLVVALAVNSGIDPLKLKVNVGNEILSSDMSFERGTDRWSIIKAACDAFVYEVFFDNEGYFVVRKFLDPTTSPISWSFRTGYEEDPDGANLVSYSKSLSDSRIYNDILVYCDPTDGEERLPYFGRATNNDPDSPTRVERLGQRTMPPIITNWLTSDAQCQELAEARLSIAALESYDMSYSSIYYPWLEVGEIAEILDPNRLNTEPTKFLMDTINYPLGLAPMDGTAKRVTFVGDAGNGSEV